MYTAAIGPNGYSGPLSHWFVKAHSTYATVIINGLGKRVLMFTELKSSRKVFIGVADYSSFKEGDKVKLSSLFVIVSKDSIKAF